MPNILAIFELEKDNLKLLWGFCLKKLTYSINVFNILFLFADGPLYINISGPESAKDGASVSLTCTTESYPECDFHWFLNNQSSPLKNGSVFNFTATRGPAAKYICIATNPVTNITMTQTKNFTIQGE